MLINNTLNTKRQRFGNIAMATTQTLRFLNTSPAIGATVVDAGSMSIPRTVVDVSRNPDAGLETGIREGSGTTNHALIGTYGLLASTLLSGQFNKKYGVKSNKIFSNFDNINALGSIWGDIVKADTSDNPLQMRKDFFNKVLDSTFGQAQNTKGELIHLPIDKKAKAMFLKDVSSYMEKSPNSYTLPTKLHKKLKSILSFSTSAESEFIVKTGKFTTSTDVDTLLKTTFSLGKIFSEPKPLNEFKKSNNILNNSFIKSLKNSKLKSSLLGVAIGMGIGASIQPINVWLTKKRTGKEGFVGVEGNKKDNSLGFKTLKAGSSLAFLGFAYSTIVGNVFKTPMKKQAGILLNKLQFNGVIPSIPQFKAIYAFTIASRMMTSRDKSELRESATKDFLGFTNWLILGDFVQKLIASSSNKGLTNYDEKVHGKGLLNKIFNLKVRVKTHDEILFEELKKVKTDLSSLTSVDGKMLSSKELLSKYYNKLPNLKSRIKGKNIAQFGGYLYLAVVLGVLIPKLNIAITNHFQKKKMQAKLDAQQGLKLAKSKVNNSFSRFE